MSRENAVATIQEKFRLIDRPLNERQRRLWAAAEAMTLGRGGIAIVAEALRMSPNTIKKGIQEIEAGESGLDSDVGTRIRKSGGGRKTKGSPPAK